MTDPSAQRLLEFFEDKGLLAIKEEDQREQWYEDWIAYQAKHRLYASLLSPQEFSTLGFEFDLLRYARFLELFAYFSPAHGYSLQVTFLGLFAILMGTNPDLKREAVAALESGGLLAFAVSEKSHGSDLLGNEFALSQVASGQFVANGTKYYIGNANSAAIITILAHKETGLAAKHARRSPVALLVLRPAQSKGFCGARKIRTMGVRAAFVGEFEVKEHELPQTDLVAEGRQAWEAVFGTVTLGKFFLGFGSIGICEHALHEAVDHLDRRTLYGKPVIEMPHIRATMAQAYARLTAMKLYAYRALDYVYAACPDDRRYLLYTAVQKAKVGAEGVKVMALLSECIGARGFESETFFEMALRDVQLIPGLEGSTHINLGLTAQFIERYLSYPDSDLPDPASLLTSSAPHGENPHLAVARPGAINTITFAHFLTAYEPLMAVPNVRLFVKQAKAFQLFIRRGIPNDASKSVTPIALAMGQCLATIAYAQLVAELSVRLSVPTQLVSVMFHLVLNDFSVAALKLGGVPGVDAADRCRIRRMHSVPATAGDEWAFVSEQMAATGGPREGGRL